MTLHHEAPFRQETGHNREPRDYHRLYHKTGHYQGLSYAGEHRARDASVKEEAQVSWKAAPQDWPKSSMETSDKGVEGDDAHLFDHFQDQQVFIHSDQGLCLACQRAGDEFIVLGVAREGRNLT